MRSFFLWLEIKLFVDDCLTWTQDELIQEKADVSTEYPTLQLHVGFIQKKSFRRFYKKDKHCLLLLQRNLSLIYILPLSHSWNNLSFAC